jgi:hypothetical protein
MGKVSKSFSQIIIEVKIYHTKEQSWLFKSYFSVTLVKPEVLRSRAGVLSSRVTVLAPFWRKKINIKNGGYTGS